MVIMQPLVNSFQLESAVVDFEEPTMVAVVASMIVNTSNARTSPMRFKLNMVNVCFIICLYKVETVRMFRYFCIDP